MIYNTNINITYKNYETDTNSDMANIMYRKDLLSIFNIQEYDFDIIYPCIEKVYPILIKHDILKQLMTFLASKHLISNKTEMGLIFLFAYEYFYIIHPCVCEIIKNNKISNENIEKLKWIMEEYK
jgi:hypothetical protein